MRKILLVAVISIVIIGKFTVVVAIVDVRDVVTATVLTTDIAEVMRAVKRKYCPIVTGLAITGDGGPVVTAEVTLPVVMNIVAGSGESETAVITPIVVLGMPIVLVDMPIIVLPTVMLEIVMLEIVTEFTIEIVTAFIVVVIGMRSVGMSS